MSVEKTEVIIVGAGQAGIAMSEHLSRDGIPHLVLEKSRIAESWRTARWDSLVANGPAWHDRFPGMLFPGHGPDDFVPKEKVADYFVDYAKMIDAPVRCGVEVNELRRKQGSSGFHLETSQGQFEANYVVVATGPFQTPVIPPIIPAQPDILQIHSAAYRNPDALPQGGVLVVGAGSSGSQIAEELIRAGRPTWLSIGVHDRPPRAYRGRDFVWWLGVLNKWDMETMPGVEHTTIAVSGAYGGHTMDFRELAHQGITLLGSCASFADGVVGFSPDLVANVTRGDANYLSLLDEADTYLTRNGLILPEEPTARQFMPDPHSMTHPISTLDLKAAGITTIIWATGYRSDYSWLKVNAVDEQGRARHSRGISAEPGIYFLGQPWQTRRGSSFIWGVWHDARYVTDHIAKQRGYLDYQPG